MSDIGGVKIICYEDLSSVSIIDNIPFKPQAIIAYVKVSNWEPVVCIRDSSESPITIETTGSGTCTFTDSSISMQSSIVSIAAPMKYAIIFGT